MTQALHILWLSPKYRDTYTFEWIDGGCPGSGYKEELPFTGEKKQKSWFVVQSSRV